MYVFFCFFSSISIIYQSYDDTRFSIEIISATLHCSTGSTNSSTAQVVVVLPGGISDSGGAVLCSKFT